MLTRFLSKIKDPGMIPWSLGFVEGKINYNNLEVGGLTCEKSEDDQSSQDEYFLPILFMNIGNWNQDSLYCGDLLAYISFKKKLLAWEILQFKNIYRIEIEFNSIGELHIENHVVEGDTLHLELNSTPQFLRGDLEPHQPTNWKRIDTISTEVKAKLYPSFNSLDFIFISPYNPFWTRYRKRIV